MNEKLPTKHRQGIRDRYKGYKVIPTTKKYYDEAEYSEDEGLVGIHTVGFDDHEYYKLIAINSPA